MKYSVDESVSEFLDYCKYELNLDHKSLKAYTIDLKQFKKHIALTDTDTINAIDKHILRKYVHHLNLEFKPRTIKRKIAVTKALFSHLELNDLIETNPFRKMKIHVKMGKILPKTINPSDLKLFFKHIYNKKHTLNRNEKVSIRNIAIIELLFSTGIRISELTGLNNEDVRIDKKEIAIWGKGHKERIISLCNASVLNALKNHIRQRKTLPLESPFFLNRTNNRLSPQSIRLMIKQHCENIKIPHTTPHMFRHTVATMLLENNMDIRYIQTFLGHHSIKTTEIYTHVSPFAQKKELLKKHPRKLFQLNEG